MFTLDGALAGGLSPMMGQGQPPAWMTYMATADADATAAAVRSAGGSVIVEPMDVMASGRFGVFADDVGAVFGVWQPGEHRGAQAVNRDGALTWDELATAEPEAAQLFYGAVFGWTLDPIEDGGRVVYASWKLDGRLIGGLLPQLPAGVPPNWLVYFGVPDLDAGVAEAERLGARTLLPRRDVPAGAFAVLADPQGATFALLRGAYAPPPA